MEARCPYKTNKEYGDGTDAAQAPCGLLGRVLEGRGERQTEKKNSKKNYKTNVKERAQHS